MKSLFYCLFMIAAIIFSPMVYAKKEVTRQLGGACGENNDIVASCASGLSCQKGYCQIKSFLSSSTVGCKQAMHDIGDTSKYVAVHDGFCYIDSACNGLYAKVVHASSVSKQVINNNGVDPKALESLRKSDQQAFQEAVTACQQCGKCVIGQQFF